MWDVIAITTGLGGFLYEDFISSVHAIMESILTFSSPIDGAHLIPRLQA